MNPLLETVIRRQDTWLGRERRFSRGQLPANSDYHQNVALPTGFASLDSALSQGGWPLGGSIEILSDASGMGAMGLFLPVMEALSRRQRWQLFIAPPFIPYAPLLKARGIDISQVLLVRPRSQEELLWSTELALRSGTCSAIFSWLGSDNCSYSALRKLQLAASASDTLSVLFRANAAAHEHTPASLRLQMCAYREVQILKQRGGRHDQRVKLPAEDDVPGQPQLWELPAEIMAGSLSHGNVAPVAS